MLSPSMAITLWVVKKPGMQESDPLHETTKLLYFIDVSVFEIGLLKSWSVWFPAAAKYAALSV